MEVQRVQRGVGFVEMFLLVGRKEDIFIVFIRQEMCGVLEVKDSG